MTRWTCRVFLIAVAMQSGVHVRAQDWVDPAEFTKISGVPSVLDEWVESAEFIADVREQLPELPPPPTSLEPKPAEPEKKPAKKKWFEKYGLRGYAQFRFNESIWEDAGSAAPDHAGDASISENQTFLIRRARMIFSGDFGDHLSIYLQPDFASSVPGSPDANHFVQIRDWYGDVYVDKEREYRFRVGQSKIPYGWENLQSSMNRLPLDRNDAFNSTTKNERDLGVFFYWTPEWAQELFQEISDKGLKGSGNYGLFGFGPYVGQGGSLREQNDQLHLVARFTYLWVLENDQIIEASIQGLTGEYVVLGSPIRPLGMGAADVTPRGTLQTGDRDGHLDNRLGWTFVYYPQPFGFQAEWTIGEGPALNAAQTLVERRSLYGGYAMVMYKLDDCHGTWIPFARWSYFKGGYKNARNAPYSEIDEWELGIEWQPKPEFELVVSYLITDRTNLQALSGGRESYGQFDGQVIRAQFQINY